MTDNADPNQINVPRDRSGTSEPQLARKYQHHLSNTDTTMLSLLTKGLTTGRTAARFAWGYAANMSKDTSSEITDEMASWLARALERIHTAVSIDMIVIKAGAEQVRNQPGYAAIGCALERSGGRPWVLPGNGDEGSTKF